MTAPGIALITGASRGIGRAIACRLSKDGFRIALNDLPSQLEALEELREQISKPGVESVIFVADVSVEGEVENMVNEVVQIMGGLDIMVANAGIIVSTKPITETSVDDFQRTMAVNAIGTFLCYKHAAVQMIKQGRGGRIIGAASLAAKKGLPLTTAYSASKFAVRGMTQSAALDLAHYGITVNAYAPGPTDTMMLEILREGKRGNATVPPIGRDATPDDIAGLVSFLASKDAAMITGQSVSINGGLFFD